MRSAPLPLLILAFARGGRSGCVPPGCWLRTAPAVRRAVTSLDLAGGERGALTASGAAVAASGAVAADSSRLLAAVAQADRDLERDLEWDALARAERFSRLSDIAYSIRTRRTVEEAEFALTLEVHN